MYTATFIYATRQFDEDFHRLDQQIASVAKALPGYLGEESWENRANGLVSTVYYWQSLEALQALMRHPTHLQAQREQAKWLAGYQVVVSQVLQMRGDGQLQKHLPVTSLG